MTMNLKNRIRERAKKSYIARKLFNWYCAKCFKRNPQELASKDYSAIEYMWANNIMDGVSETEFAPDAALTKGALENALANLAGTEATSTDDTKARRSDVIKAVLRADEDATFMEKLKAFGFAIKCFINNFKFNFLSEITRAEAAVILYDYINL